MQRTLRQILRVVGISKHKRNVEKWVDSVLNSATVSYGRNTTLTSNCRIPFGVIDADFECKSFVLYSEYSNTDYDREITEKEVYTFSTLSDEGFIKRVHKAYAEHFDSIKELRLYFLNQEVRFWVENKDLSMAIIGEYNDIENIDKLKVWADIWALGFEDRDEVFIYTDNIDTIKRKLVELKEVFNEKKWSDERGCWEYDTSCLWVMYGKEKAEVNIIGREAKGEEWVEVSVRI